MVLISQVIVVYDILCINFMNLHYMYKVIVAGFDLFLLQLEDIVFNGTDYVRDIKLLE